MHVAALIVPNVGNVNTKERLLDDLLIRFCRGNLHPTDVVCRVFDVEGFEGGLSQFPRLGTIPFGNTLLHSQPMRPTYDGHTAFVKHLGKLVRGICGPHFTQLLILLLRPRRINNPLFLHFHKSNQF